MEICLSINYISCVWDDGRCTEKVIGKVLDNITLKRFLDHRLFTRCKEVEQHFRKKNQYMKRHRGMNSIGSLGIKPAQHCSATGCQGWRERQQAGDRRLYLSS